MSSLQYQRMQQTQTASLPPASADEAAPPSAPAPKPSPAPDPIGTFAASVGEALGSNPTPTQEGPMVLPATWMNKPAAPSQAPQHSPQPQARKLQASMAPTPTSMG